MIIEIDEGIGAYDWGAKGIHHDYVEVSNCCHAEVYFKAVDFYNKFL